MSATKRGAEKESAGGASSVAAGGRVSDAALAERYQPFLDIQDDIAAGIPATGPGPTKESVRERLAAGAPVLSFEDFFPAWAQARPAFQRVLGWANGEGAGRAGGAPGVSSPDVGEALFRELAKVWYRGELTSPLVSSQADQELVALVGACLRPFLKTRARLVMPMVEQDMWRRRYCPVCGGRPDFGYLDREQGARWLVCWRCDSEWLFQRVECPYCGIQDQTKLSYFTDDTEQYRLYLCDACKTYLKVIDLRKAQRNIRLELERFVTLHMDQQARASCYLPGY